MRLSGKDAISKNTKLTARTLLSVSGVAVFMATHGAPIDKFSLLGLEFSGTDVTRLFPLLLVFLTVNHIVQWIADMLSFRAWNLVGQSNDVDQRLGSSSLTTKLDIALSRINFAEKRLKQVELKPRQPDKEFSIREALEFLANAETQLSEMRSEVIKMVWLPPFPERHQSANMSGA